MSNEGTVQELYSNLLKVLHFSSYSYQTREIFLLASIKLMHHTVTWFLHYMRQRLARLYSYKQVREPVAVFNTVEKIIHV